MSNRKTKVNKEMCATCPWRPSTRIFMNQEDFTRTYDMEVIRAKLTDVNLLHVCHERPHKHRKWNRCKGSYEVRKKLFREGAIRFSPPIPFA